jgi:hypothetical protein
MSDSKKNCFTLNSTYIRNAKDGTWVYCYKPKPNKSFVNRHPILSMPKGSEASQIKHQEHFDLFKHWVHL